MARRSENLFWAVDPSPANGWKTTAHRADGFGCRWLRTPQGTQVPRGGTSDVWYQASQCITYRHGHRKSFSRFARFHSPSCTESPVALSRTKISRDSNSQTISRLPSYDNWVAYFST